MRGSDSRAGGPPTALTISIGIAAGSAKLGGLALKPFRTDRLALLLVKVGVPVPV